MEGKFKGVRGIIYIDIMRETYRAIQASPSLCMVSIRSQWDR